MIPVEIVHMVAEATSPHNDGETRASYQQCLLRIRDYINKALAGSSDNS